MCKTVCWTGIPSLLIYNGSGCIISAGFLSQVLVIAHRLETVLMAERVLLLDDGKLQELKHSTLLGGEHDKLASSGIVI